MGGLAGYRSAGSIRPAPCGLSCVRSTEPIKSLPEDPSRRLPRHRAFRRANLRQTLSRPSPDLRQTWSRPLLAAKSTDFPLILLYFAVWKRFCLRSAYVLPISCLNPAYILALLPQSCLYPAYILPIFCHYPVYSPFILLISCLYPAYILPISCHSAYSAFILLISYPTPP